MVRRRGHSRRSYAWLRIKQYRLKYTHHVIPIQFKLLIPHMSTRIEVDLGFLDYLEIQVFAYLLTQGVDEALWKIYMGFAKRVYHFYTNFRANTAANETAVLLSEYVLRGNDQAILEGVRDIAIEKGRLYRGVFPTQRILNSSFSGCALPPWFRIAGIVNADNAQFHTAPCSAFCKFGGSEMQQSLGTRQALKSLITEFSLWSFAAWTGQCRFSIGHNGVWTPYTSTGNIGVWTYQDILTATIYKNIPDDHYIDGFRVGSSAGFDVWVDDVSLQAWKEEDL